MNQQSHWPHAPKHQLSETGTFFVTAGTYKKQHLFFGSERLGVLERGLCQVLREGGWQLEAWAVFPNHYHFLAGSPENAEDASSLTVILGKFHEITAKWINKRDQTAGRKVWHNFWDTRLTYEKSYFARLNYTHQNPVHHGLVKIAHEYPWCSAAWFEANASAALRDVIYSFPTDRVNVADDFEISSGW
jgi:putative transposase